MKGRKKSTKRSGKQKGDHQENLMVVPAHTIPRTVTDQLCTGFTFRFVTTGIGGAPQTNVTFANLLDAWMIAASSTNAYQLFDFVKVRRVTVRAYSTGAANTMLAATVGVEFPGLVIGQAGGGKQGSDSSLGMRPAVVSLAPDRGSQAAQWQASSSNVAFTLRAVDYNSAVIIGALIDVDVSLKNSADVNPAAVGSAPAGMSTGNLYFGGIDGARLAATWARSVFIPRV